MNHPYYLISSLLFVLGLTLSLTATPSLLLATRTNIAFAQPSSTPTGSNNTDFLSFDSKKPLYTHRSAAAEWEPHQKQTNYTQEWWYTTAFLNDAKGNLYSLLFVDMKIDGEKVPFLMFNPL